MAPLVSLRSPMPPLVVPGAAPRAIGVSWPEVDRTTERPGYMLTPDRVWQIHREADTGIPRRQCLMFEDGIESDGHLRGDYDGRMRAVADRDFEVAPGEGGNEALNAAAAEALRTDLARTNLAEAIWHHQESVFYGYAGVQPRWDVVDQGRIAPVWFDIVEHQRWSFPVSDQLDGQPRLRTAANPYPGIGLEGPPGSWWFTAQRHRVIQRAGLMRTAIWWAVFKRMSVRDWMVFAEKFGLPIVIGQYQERAADETRRALEQAIADVGTDGQAVISDAAKIVVQDAGVRNGDVGALHPSVVALCNAEISKLIKGATLTSDTGGPGSFALGRVHENRQTSLTFADAKVLARSFEAQIARPYVAYNPRFRGAAAPQLWIHVQPEIDTLTDVKIAEILQQMGFPIDRGQIGRRLGWRPASSPASTLVRIPDAPSSPPPDR